MKIPKFFDKDITPKCSYCSNCRIDDNSIFICTLNNTNENNKCQKFVYNPLMRVPEAIDPAPAFDKDEFTL